MTGFLLHLQSATQYERFEGVTAFQGRDASGAFGILPGHERMMTSLGLGLARFRTVDGAWNHLAIPRGILTFVGNELSISARRYVWDPDPAAILRALDQQLRREEESLARIKRSVQQLEEGMFKRLWKRGRGTE